jgi:flagellum-specific peptidoglycan hydrolase FlgJ
MVTINDNFRKYDTIERSFADYLLFLTYASNYGPGGKPKYGREVLDIKDPATLIKTVSARGYATG